MPILRRYIVTVPRNLPRDHALRAALRILRDRGYRPDFRGFTYNKRTGRCVLT